MPINQEEKRTHEAGSFRFFNALEQPMFRCGDLGVLHLRPIMWCNARDGLVHHASHGPGRAPIPTPAGQSMRYEAPTTIETAVSLLAAERGQVFLLAGGTDSSCDSFRLHRAGSHRRCEKHRCHAPDHGGKGRLPHRRARSARHSSASIQTSGSCGRGSSRRPSSSARNRCRDGRRWSATCAMLARRRQRAGHGRGRRHGDRRAQGQAHRARRRRRNRSRQDHSRQGRDRRIGISAGAAAEIGGCLSAVHPAHGNGYRRRRRGGEPHARWFRQVQRRPGIARRGRGAGAARQ